MSSWPLIQELHSELLAYARSIADTPEGAEDLVSDAIERAARAETPPKDRRAFEIWMFRIIKNLSIDELRKRRIRREYSADVARLYWDVGSPAASPEMAILLRRAFEKLGPVDREILCLVDVLGMKYAEAAEVIGVPIGTNSNSSSTSSLVTAIQPIVQSFQR